MHPPVTYCSLRCWLHYIVSPREDLINTVATQLNMTGILRHLFCTTLPRKLTLAIRNFSLSFTLSLLQLHYRRDMVLVLFFNPDDFASHPTHTTHEPRVPFSTMMTMQTIPAPVDIRGSTVIRSMIEALAGQMLQAVPSTLRLITVSRLRRFRAAAEPAVCHLLTLKSC